jgi:hypothetical protein
MSTHDQTRHDAGFVHEYRIDLLFAEEPSVAPSLTTAAVAFVEEGSRLRLTIDESVTMLDALARPFDPQSTGSSIEQSWNWRGAEETVALCRYALTLSDIVEDSVDPRLRVESLRRTAAAVIAALSPQAVHSVPSKQLLAPHDLREAFLDQGGDVLYGLVNIRFFKIEGGDRGIAADYDETVMDTLGLGALGLHDLQCQFKLLPPPRIGEFLYNTAYYLFAKGPVIESGHTLRGIAPDQTWSCRFEDSAIEPARVVLDINPGKPYAAGVRD